MEVTPIELVRCTCCAALTVAELRRNWPGVPAGELSGEPTPRVRGAGYGAALFARCARACDGEPRSLEGELELTSMAGAGEAARGTWLAASVEANSATRRAN